MGKFIKNHWLLLVLFFLLIPSVWFLLKPGFFESDDGGWMVIRFSAFYQALVDGQFPVRFLGRLNHGFGYPVANFLYPGFMYFAVPIHLLGLSFVDSIKAILVFSMIGTAFFSYLWLSKIFDKFSASIGTLFATYVPYHLFDLYRRGSVGELFAFVWVAFTLWMIEKRNMFFVSMGIFLLAISHNTIFLLFAPFLFLYSIIRKKITTTQTVTCFVFGFLISSFFTIPALLELQYTNFTATKVSNISEYFVGLGLVGASCLVVMLGSLVSYIERRKKDSLFLMFFLMSILGIFMSLSISEPIWKVLPSNLIQFPFRMLSYLIFGTGFLAAYLIYNLKKQSVAVTGLMILLLIVSAYQYLSPKNVVEVEDVTYSTNEATTTVQDEYMPSWVKEKPVDRYKDKIEIIEGVGEISNLFYNNSKKVSFDIKSSTEAKVRLNTIYYPGWSAKINDNQVTINYQNSKGVIEISVPSGSNSVEFVFGETPIRLAADILSGVSFISLLFLRRKDLLNFKTA